MLNKPPTVALLAALVALIVTAAGTGAYLAIRQNTSDAAAEPATSRAAATPTTNDASGATPGDTSQARAGVGMETAEAGAVHATEQIVEPPPAAAPAPAPPPRATPTPDPAPAAAPAPPPAPAPAPAADTPPPGPKPRVEPESVKRPAPAPARRTARDLPEIDGWERIESRWPTRDDDPEPREIVLDIDPDSVEAPISSGPPPPVIIENLTIEADSVVGLQIDSFVTTEVARVEDDVQARVTRDVLVDGQVAVPAGTIVMGSVVLVEQGGKIKGASRLGVRFHTIVFDDGVEAPMMTETVYREGSSRGGQSAAKIGGAAVGGAILGAIFGGSRGAAIGGAAGAAGGTAAAAAGGAEPATLPAGTTVTVRLSRPATVTIER